MVRHELQNWQVCLIVMYEHYLKTGKTQMRVGEILNEIRRHDPNWANTRGSADSRINHHAGYGKRGLRLPKDFPLLPFGR